MNYMLVPLKRYFDFQGRSRRMEFWMFFLFQIIVNIVLSIAMVVLGGTALLLGGAMDSMAPAGGVVAVLSIINLLFTLALLIPNIAVSIRRLHDTNRTGWWLLAPVVLYSVGFLFIVVAFSAPDTGVIAGIVSTVAMLAGVGMAITLLVFYFLDGTPGPNRFGGDPKQRSYEETFR